MSTWLDGPIEGPLVHGDLCESGAGYQCAEDATVIAENVHGSHIVLCGYHAERHGIVAEEIAA